MTSLCKNYSPVERDTYFQWIVFVYGRAFSDMKYLRLFEMLDMHTFRGPALTTTIGGLGVPLESVLATSVVLQSTLSPVLTEALAESRS